MRRTAFAVGVGAVAVGAVIVGTLAGCSISIGAMGQGSSRASGARPAVTSPAAPASPVISPVAPSAGSAGSSYLALVGPANTATFALDSAVLKSSANLTTQSLSAVIAASAGALQTFNDRLRSTTWPRTAEPDITTLAAANDVLVVVLQGYESDLRAPTPGADFNAILEDLQVDGSRYAIDRGLASDASARVRADLGLPPPSTSHVTLND